MDYEPEWRETWENKMKKDIMILDVLLVAGANPNIVDQEGNTALHLVAYNVPEKYQIYVAQKLIQHGAIFRVKNNKGQTAIDIAPPSLQEYLKRFN
jgi:ankyrin repeat protein